VGVGGGGGGPIGISLLSLCVVRKLTHYPFGYMIHYI
jgi:hypothetical protein